MAKTLLRIACVTALCCAMNLWQFNFPPRVFVFDLLCAVFIIIFYIYKCVNQDISPLRKELKYFIGFQWLVVFVMLVSSLKVAYLFPSEETITQCYKGLLTEILHNVFFACFVLFLSNLRQTGREKILFFYIVGVTGSCIYGMIQMALLSKVGINIDHLWDRISLNVANDFEENLTWSVGGVYRGRGFPGINSAATYAATALPWLLMKSFHYRRLRDIMLSVIVLIGIFITMSRTGFITIAVALLLMVLFEKKRWASRLMLIAVVMAPLGIIARVYWDNISSILLYRTSIDQSRLELYKGAIYLFLQNPLLGVGPNNYYVARYSLPSSYDHDANVHNSWLNILIETGLVGLCLKAIFFIYILRICLRNKGILSRSFICVFVGLSFGAVFNMIFDTFYFNFFIVMAFTLIVLENNVKEPASSRSLYRGQALGSIDQSVC